MQDLIIAVSTADLSSRSHELAGTPAIVVVVGAGSATGFWVLLVTKTIAITSDAAITTAQAARMISRIDECVGR
ncbi:hypothetical protein ACFXO7_01490 [Nocardia tengchongensis]|uniref:hypothetical protein n=1 Tax=Nocardia tengchongensis TaxID=2055889 RepID=UPI0036AD0F16